MINHARTLLANLDGPGVLQQPGDEFIPGTYRKLQLPGYLVGLRSILFGTAPDRMFINYRVRQLMTMLHTTELAEFVTDLDNRVTYWPSTKRDFFDETVFVPRLTVVNVHAPSRVYIRGVPTADEALGRLNELWAITLIGGNRVRITKLDHNDGLTTTRDFIVEGGLSEFLQLPGSHLSVLIGKTDYEHELPVNEDGIVFLLFSAPDGTVNKSERAMYLTRPYAAPFGLVGRAADAEENLRSLTGATWYLEITARPASDISTMVPRLQNMLSESAALQLFGVNPPEPFKTFRNLWEDHPHLPYKVGGLLLGMIYRTDTLRR